MPPRAHNLTSYGGALFVFVFVFAARMELGDGSPMRRVALLAAALWCVHFARRIVESAWVHRYGKDRVPTGDVIVEYGYYWGFAAWNAVSLTSSSYTAPTAWRVGLGTIVFVVAETGNARAHRMLRDLRPAGTKTRLIPRGFLFERVSSPHYLFEILSWLGSRWSPRPGPRARSCSWGRASWRLGRILGTSPTSKISMGSTAAKNIRPRVARSSPEFFDRR